MYFRVPYEQIFGGVSALTPYQFEVVNGYSNEYWGWGGEDDDMFLRRVCVKQAFDYILLYVRCLIFV